MDNNFLTHENSDLKREPPENVQANLASDASSSLMQTPDISVHQLLKFEKNVPIKIEKNDRDTENNKSQLQEMDDNFLTHENSDLKREPPENVQANLASDASSSLMQTPDISVHQLLKIEKNVPIKIEKNDEDTENNKSQLQVVRQKMEQQRQPEWEEQCEQELLAQCQKVQESVCYLKNQNKNLPELKQLSGKIIEISKEITEQNSDVYLMKRWIANKCVYRDSILNRMNEVEARIKEMNEIIASQPEYLENVETYLASYAGSSLLHSTDIDYQERIITNVGKELEKKEKDLENNKSQLKELKARLSCIQKDIEWTNQCIKDNKGRLQEMHDKLRQLFEKHKNLYEEYEQEKEKVFELRKPREVASGINEQQPGAMQEKINSIVKRTRSGRACLPRLRFWTGERLFTSLNMNENSIYIPPNPVGICTASYITPTVGLQERMLTNVSHAELTKIESGAKEERTKKGKVKREKEKEENED